MSKVDKFSPYHDGSMQFDIDGGWVSYDDYKESADRIEELEAVLREVAAWVDDLGLYAQEGHEPVAVFKRVKEVLNK